MKVNICFEEVSGPWGGGNQFLKYLKKMFKKNNLYEEDSTKADVILFNSHHNIQNVFNIKKRNKNALFIHRIDGPVSLIRGIEDKIDIEILKTSNSIADAIIVQSEWSKNKLIEIARKNNFKINKPLIKILNTADSDFFSLKNKIKNKKGQIKIVSTSWSDNLRKGFKCYKLIDNMLTKEKDISYDFIGRSPFLFNNIKIIKPLETKELGKKLGEYDVYITASEKDPCSNALCEAIQSGLFPVIKDDGGHEEICNYYGVDYIKFKEINNNLIEKIRNKIQNQIQEPKFEQSYFKYANLFYNMLSKKEKKEEEYETFYRQGIKIINFESKKIDKVLEEILKNKIEEGHYLEKKYEKAYDLKPSAFSYRKFFIEELINNSVHKHLDSILKSDMVLFHIQVRISENEKSYMPWHRDTYYDNSGKKIGKAPNGVKVIYYPSFGEESLPRLHYLLGSHRLIFPTNQYDNQLFNILNAAQINSSNNSAILFDTSGLHSVIPETSGKKSIRLIYSFLNKNQVINDHGENIEHMNIVREYEKLKKEAE